MFGYRFDGVKTKDLPAFFKVIPHIMKTRSDSQVFFKQDISITEMEKYIDKKQKEGIKISYMTIIFSAIVRVLAQRPQLNRFVINGRIYDRKGIYISLAIKKNMTDDGIETTVKLPFTGNENIFEVQDKLEKIINDNKQNSKQNDTDKVAIALGLIPNFLLSFAVSFLKFLDKYGLMPRFIIKASPFHTSAFLTNRNLNTFE